MAIVRAHIIISGRVQGVNFRAYVKKKAESMRLVGWVRNLSDGKVEAVFEGETEDVRRMVTWCNIGPPAARVDDVKTDWDTAAKDLSGFELRRSASVR